MVPSFSLNMKHAFVRVLPILLILGIVLVWVLNISADKAYSGGGIHGSGSGSILAEQWKRKLIDEACYSFYFDEDPRSIVLATISDGLAQQNAKAFFDYPGIKKLLSDKRVKITQLCLSRDASKASFVAYRQYEDKAVKKANNIIGTVSVWPRKAFRKIEKFVPSSGDIGLCRITGSIEMNPIYECGGGDGPGGFNAAYILNRKTGKETTLKDCVYGGDVESYTANCKNNGLNLPEIPTAISG